MASPRNMEGFKLGNEGCLECLCCNSAIQIFKFNPPHQGNIMRKKLVPTPPATVKEPSSLPRKLARYTQKQLKQLVAHLEAQNQTSSARYKQVMQRLA